MVSNAVRYWNRKGNYRCVMLLFGEMLQGPPPCLDKSSKRVSKSCVFKTSLDCAKEPPLTL